MIMADCGKYDQTVLWAYLRDQLPVQDMIKVQYHLLSCVSCQKRIANMRKLSLAMSSVELSKKKSVFYKSRWFYIAWAACFLVFFLAGVSYYMVFVDNVEEYLHASDIYISSSKSEGLPNGVLEAMACGLPLIVSNIPQHTEIIELNKKSGLTYRLGDIDDLKEKINQMLIQDLIAMGNESNKVVIQDLSAELMSKRYQDIYKEIIKNELNS